MSMADNFAPYCPYTEKETRKEVCKTLWGAFDEFMKEGRFNGILLGTLDELKVKLVEALPYGPDEVS